MGTQSLRDGDPVRQTRGRKRAEAVAPTTTSTTVAAANTSRISLTIVNNGSQVVYIGPRGVTTSNGIPVAANGGAYEDVTSLDAWFAVTAAGTGDLRILEVS